nr:ATP-binding cassette domain-containing protein [uncultured Desulfobulbus sp.]
MSLYQLQRLQQRFSQKTVLDIDELSIEQGAIHALLGPNGAGKTTLLNILAFLETPVSGTLYFQGELIDYTKKNILHLRRQVVLVDQHPIMFSTSVRSNIEFGLKIRKIDGASRERRVDEVLEIVGLTRYKQDRADALSGGETQRLALARALALEPKVLLCDEPTASVDAENQAVITELLRAINREQKTTIVFTTHDRLQAATLAQHTLVLENGRRVNTTYENSYASILEPTASGKDRFLLHGVVELCFSEKIRGRKQAGRGRLTLDPESIVIVPDLNEQSEKGHLLEGRVVMVMEEGKNIRVVVDVGVLMVVLMQTKEYAQKRPLIGSQVCVSIPDTACTWTKSA